MASRGRGAAEGGRGGDGVGAEQGGASPLQGTDMFAFIFTHEFRFGVYNATGVLQSETAVSFRHWDLPVEHALT